MTCKLESLIVFSTAQSLLLTDSEGTDQAISLAAGSYYHTSTANGGAASLLAALKTALENGGARTYTVTLDDTGDNATGQVTIAVDSGTFAITWVGTTLRDLLGFTGNIAAAASATGANHAKRLWLPDADPIATAPWPSTTGDPIGDEEVDYAASVAPSGAAAFTTFNTRQRAMMRFENIRGFRRWKMLETTGSRGLTNCSWQTFFRDLMAAGGGQWRFYPDRSDDSVYHELFFDPEFMPQTERLGPEGWDGELSLWAIMFGVRQYVHV